MTPGPILFARYAFRPNELGYCGGDDERALFQYTLEERVDGGLLQLERQFEGAYPYLQLIARANGIADPLDSRVVEAYWLGNGLLERVDMRLLFDSIRSRFAARTPPDRLKWLMAKVPAGARPHHSFHVFEVYPRAGLMKGGAVEHVFETMEQCRIRPAKVLSVEGALLLVEARPLEQAEGKLRLGQPRAEYIRRWVDGKGFVDDVKPGDTVSVHWGWACDLLSPRQAASLERYTRWHLELCNQTM